jgi:hypothetical protein
MTSHELAHMLLNTPDQPILSWCPDAEGWEDVTGFTYGDGGPGSEVTLYNDVD